MSSGTVIMAEPVCLIEKDKDGNLGILPQAVEILKQIEQPVVVVAVVGPYHAGKSYLMNKLAGKSPREIFREVRITFAKTMGLLGLALGAALGAGATVVAVPLVVGALGFTAAGIATGSIASGMMSSAAVANGGAVVAGSLVAVLQSVGVVGVSTAGTAATSGVVGAIAAILI
ncbi:hypothetical protein SKAU_G00421180 [Synaphobranchus kaupii]|uniref:GB1/RHD3-type G domain-containing protein n=1 Tax=Synaphobranchus kaupii TaxID=118154 RepID=A0A9Q1E6P2_SYNKA|nr:hypothetical protein SKAU_G00421180 [Synaphobranchus kaupii]